MLIVNTSINETNDASLNHIRGWYELKIEPGYHCTGLALTTILKILPYHVRGVRTVYRPTVKNLSFSNQNHPNPFKKLLWTSVAMVDSSFSLQ